MKLQHSAFILHRTSPNQRSGNNEQERLKRELWLKKADVDMYRMKRDEAFWPSTKAEYSKLLQKAENEYAHIAQSLARSDETYEAIRIMQNLDWMAEQSLPQQLEDIALDGEEERAFIQEEMRAERSEHYSIMSKLRTTLYRLEQEFKKEGKLLKKASRKLTPVLATKNKLIQRKFAIYDKKAQQFEKAYKFPLREVRLKVGAVAGAISFGVGPLFGGAGVADKAIQKFENTLKPVVPQLIHTIKK
jgi:hypothetical protein